MLVAMYNVLCKGRRNNSLKPSRIVIGNDVFYLKLEKLKMLKCSTRF